MKKKVEAWETAGLSKPACWRNLTFVEKQRCVQKSGPLNYLNTVQSLATEGLMCWAVKLSKSPCEKLFPHKVRNRHGIIYSSVEGALIYLQPQSWIMQRCTSSVLLCSMQSCNMLVLLILPFDSNNFRNYLHNEFIRHAAVAVCAAQCAHNVQFVFWWIFWVIWAL